MKRRRTRSIRSRILTLLFAPLIPLLGMWVFSTTATFGPASELMDLGTNVDHVGIPATAIVRELQVERKLSVLFVSPEKAESQADLFAQRTKTDAEIANFLRLSAAPELQDAANDQTKYYLTVVKDKLALLDGERRAVDSRTAKRSQVISLYDTILDSMFALYAANPGVSQQQLVQQTATVVSLTESREMLSREDALVAGVFKAGAPTDADRDLMDQLVSVQRSSYQRSTRYLYPDDRRSYEQILGSEEYKRLQKMETEIASGGTDLSFKEAQWRADFDRINQQLLDLETAAAIRIRDTTMSAAISIIVRFAVAGGVGLLIIVIMIVISLRVARNLIRRILKLRAKALEVAQEQLPDVVSRLRAGGEVDVAAETQPIDDRPDELGQLGDAFVEVKRTAITSAVQEAALRQGLNQVFLNIARRNQVLLHRQLSLLDQMERRVTDPTELEELFRIDHLAARMRRHAEDLVILAGAHPGRGWRNPVPLADVLRAAVSEVEQYTRIAVIGVPELSLAGRAVSDAVHLLAELLENATLYSPGDTQVKLSGQLVPNGFAVEIEDRGVGMPAADLARANTRLSQPPEFDPAHSSRLGLFVVSKLAARHGIQVTLRPSPYGGITAVALIPLDLVVQAEERGRHQASAIESETRELALVSSFARIDSGNGEGTFTQRVGGLENGRHSATIFNGDSVRRADVTAAVPVAAAVPAAGVSVTAAIRPDVEVPAANPRTAEGLPLRQRQASLSPRLRRRPAEDGTEAGAATTADTPGTGPESEANSEQMRSRLSLLQAATNRGRRDAAAQPPVTDEMPATDEE